MMNGLVIMAGVLAGILLLAAAAWIVIRRNLRNMPEAALLRQAAEAVRNGDINDRLSSTPKSLSAMNRIYLPQILEDFPEFNWEEFKPVIADGICRVLRAIDERNAELAGKEPGLRTYAEQALSGGQIPHYKAVKVHDTVISRYDKERGTCVIRCESAVEYYMYAEENGRVVSGYKDRKRQEVYETDLVYVQNVQAIGTAPGRAGTGTAGGGAAGVGLTCPNCGAPVRNLGMKVCEYCGSAIEPLNLRVWKINSVRRM